jgi:hypothetical protein
MHPLGLLLSITFSTILAILTCSLTPAFIQITENKCCWMRDTRKPRVKARASNMVRMEPGGAGWGARAGPVGGGAPRPVAAARRGPGSFDR